MKAALLVIALHGGGWVGGSPANVQPVVDSLNNRGVPAISIPYTLGNYPQAIRDVRAAIGQARLRYKRVTLYGISAGATLAAYLAARGEADTSVVESGPVDFVTWRAEHPYFGTLQHYQDIGLDSMCLRARYSPVRRLSGPSPMLGLYAPVDPLVPASQGRQLDRVPGARIIVKRGGGHYADPRYRASIAKFLSEG